MNDRLESNIENTSYQLTVVIPSFNQGKYLEKALLSIIATKINIEIFVVDGGSTDNTLDIIKKYETSITGWCSEPDDGQSWAINKGMKLGSSPLVTWLNADDTFYPEGLQRLVTYMEKNPSCSMVYGKGDFIDIFGHCIGYYPTRKFSEYLFATYCIVSQPAVVMRRSTWEAVNGVDESLHMCMDYDLWWRIYKEFGPLTYFEDLVASTRIHDQTKTSTKRRQHYVEAMTLVKKHYGRVPIKWYLFWPYKVWYLEWKNK